MITITDTISFDDTKKLQEQSTDFQNWLFENCLSKINDQLTPNSLDSYNRPENYTFTVNTLNVSLTPLYLFQDKSNWAISGYNILIN